MELRPVGADHERPPRWAMQRVLSLLRRHPELSVRDVAERTGLRPVFVRACVLAIGAPPDGGDGTRSAGSPATREGTIDGS